MRRWLVRGAMLGAMAVAAGLAIQARTQAPEWRYWGGDKAFTRYLPLDQITPANVGQLRVAWRKPGVDPSLKER